MDKEFWKKTISSETPIIIQSKIEKYLAAKETRRKLRKKSQSNRYYGEKNG